MSHDQTNPTTTALLLQAVVGAGDADRSVLGTLVARRLLDLPASAILEITSLAPTHRIDVLKWCREMGHDCFQMSVDGDRTWFWIKKR